VTCDGQYRVVATGGDVRPGGAGELWLAAPSAFVGYWNSATRSVEREPAHRWIRTGDLFSQEPDGQLRFLGRLTEIIVRGGANVSPAEVENVLREHEAVAQVGVTSRPDPDYGEEIVAYVEPTDPGDADLGTSLDVIARAQLAEYKVPTSIYIVESLPLTAAGKIDRVTLRAWAQSEGHDST
jgi:acyl-CoA synthetase (AMP-forming)/AMP-acid ligase II